jgi:type IV pilus assembly protein PilP
MICRFFWSLGAACLTVLLCACGTAADDELTQWMTEQKSQTHAKVTPLAEPKQFKPETYNQLAEVEPFSQQKLTLALKRDTADATPDGALLAPELSRRKEPLEEFPLDTMAMVGHMVRAGKPMALVTVGKMLYQVHPGEHLGQNYGLITKITETEVTLREIVQDAAGEWIERIASLQLQERSK